jgi:HD-GYP domain-containing protein (c-di-GMP phosphodiesterase class II)
MTTARVYHNETSSSQAIKEIRSGSGSRYDPTIVEAFLEVLRRFEE